MVAEDTKIRGSLNTINIIHLVYNLCKIHLPTVKMRKSKKQCHAFKPRLVKIQLIAFLHTQHDAYCSLCISSLAATTTKGYT